MVNFACQDVLHVFVAGWWISWLTIQGSFACFWLAFIHVRMELGGEKECAPVSVIILMIPKKKMTAKRKS